MSSKNHKKTKVEGEEKKKYLKKYIYTEACVEGRARGAAPVRFVVKTRQVTTTANMALDGAEPEGGNLTI